MKKVLTIIFAVCLLFSIAACSSDSGKESLTQPRSFTETEQTQETQQTVTETPAETHDIPTQTFLIYGGNYKYWVTREKGEFYEESPELTVKLGTKVKIIFENRGGYHDWAIDEFNARTKTIDEGETAEVEFVANKKGRFMYYCSVGQHKEMGMFGYMTVE